MPSALDLMIDGLMEKFTAAGAPLELGERDLFGRPAPYLKTAPPTLPAYFAQYCAQHGEAIFMVDGATRLSFAEAHAHALRLAHALVARHGVTRGLHVGIAARNSANWIILYMAVLMAGGCATLVNGWWTGEEMTQGILLAEVPLVLADAERAARLDGRQHGARVLTFGHEPVSGLEHLIDGAEAGELPALTGDDKATILFTSGSTGQSKAAWSTHRAVVQAVLNYAAQSLTALTVMQSQGVELKYQPASLVCVPLFHVTGAVPLFLQSFVLGRKLVLMPKWNAREAMRLIAAERVTYFVGVPLMSYEIATHPERADFDLSSCLHYAAGGAPRPVAHVDAIRGALPHAFPLLGYGLTETNAVGCGNINENYLAKPGSTGPISRPLVELSILDEAGTPLATGAVGEVAIRSVCNFSGYWNNPEATAAAFTADGHFRTGDLGYLDGDGYLFIVDRKKDIVIRGGENIACLEVEQAIYAHPQVAEASVFGLPHERFGEVPVAVFLAKPGSSLSEAELRAFLCEHLAAFKVPVRLWREEGTLPRLGTEKVDKRALKARYASGWDDVNAGA